MHSVLSLILGGGRGTRLLPLTQLRSKPAVPIAGKYRLIDIPISNCINSGFNRIYVLTQFLSVSLHRHIANTYKFDPFSRGFVEVLAAQQTNEAADWYQGTADAVRQQIRYVHEDGCSDVLIHMLNAPPLAPDFGREIFPRSIKTHLVQAHLFDGYWEDVGTVKAYHDANLALTSDEPPFDFHSPDGVIFTRMRYLPASRISSSGLEQCLISDGCVIEAGTHPNRCVVGVGSRIGRNVTLRYTGIIGAGRFETSE